MEPGSQLQCPVHFFLNSFISNQNYSDSFFFFFLGRCNPSTHTTIYRYFYFHIFFLTTCFGLFLTIFRWFFAHMPLLHWSFLQCNKGICAKNHLKMVKNRRKHVVRKNIWK
jgi:hypothetical protein